MQRGRIITSPLPWRPLQFEPGARNSMSPTIADLPSLPEGAATEFGGKADGLRKLFSLDAKVPAGFSVSATTTMPSRWSGAEKKAFREKAAELLRTGPVSVWANFNVRETLPDPLYPLAWSGWRDVVSPVFASHVSGLPRSSPALRHLFYLDLIQGRMYFNLNAVVGPMKLPVIGPVIVEVQKDIDARATEIIQELISDNVLQPRRMPGSRWLAPVRGFLPFLRCLWRVRHMIGPRRELKKQERLAVAIRCRPQVARLSDAELLDELNLIGRPECHPMLANVHMLGASLAVYVAARWGFKGHSDALRLLTTGISANPTTQISIGVDELTEAARPLFWPTVLELTFLRVVA